MVGFTDLHLLKKLYSTIHNFLYIISVFLHFMEFVSSLSMQRLVSLRTWTLTWTPVTTSTSMPVEGGLKRTSSLKPPLDTAPLTSYEMNWRSSSKVRHLHTPAQADARTERQAGNQTKVFIQIQFGKSWDAV